MTGPALDLDILLTQATEDRASDLHIRVGMPPMARVDSHLRPLRDFPPVTKEQATELVARSTTDEQKKKFYEEKSLDFSRAVAGVARFRCAYFLQQGLMAMVYRRIPDQIPTLAELGAPSILLEWARASRGLVLVTGPTGSGKSTTLAALLDVINTERADHILTIEDPIEFVHPPKRCVVNQREIGRDAPNFAHALRGALRQDPDVILVGEMRDLETIATAITAAETGHLVFGTLHTSTAPSTIDRIIDQYPAGNQDQIRVMLASSLLGIVTQTLVPRADGPGRVACHEVLVVNNAISNYIRHQQMEQVRGAMQTQSKLGMQTMDRALAYNVFIGKVAEDVARERAVNVGEFDQTLGAFRKGNQVAIPQLVQPGQGSMSTTAPGGAVGMAPSAAASAVAPVAPPAPAASAYAQPMNAPAPIPAPAPAPAPPPAAPAGLPMGQPMTPPAEAEDDDGPSPLGTPVVSIPADADERFSHLFKQDWPEDDDPTPPTVS